MGDRLTARSPKNNMAYLVKVRPDEQEVESSYPNTLKCILEGFNRLAEYEDFFEQNKTTPSELAELVKARGEGRMLPEGFSCVMLSDEKTLAVFYPEGKCVASEPRQYFTVSEKKEAL